MIKFLTKEEVFEIETLLAKAGASVKGGRIPDETYFAVTNAIIKVGCTLGLRRGLAMGEIEFD